MTLHTMIHEFKNLLEHLDDISENPDRHNFRKKQIYTEEEFINMCSYCKSKENKGRWLYSTRYCIWHDSFEGD